MYIKDGRGWNTRDGTQHSRGEFLVIFDDPEQPYGKSALRACVRVVSMASCGHWMMGQVRLAGHRISLSGTYGADGLPLCLNHKDLPAEIVSHIWDSLTPLPADLQKEFWAGGGHNCAGKEGPLLRAWALENIKDLKKTVSIKKAVQSK